MRIVSRAATGRAEQNQMVLDAIGRSQALIEFMPDGTIIDANDNFLALLGYEREEIRGQHHRLFVDPAESALPAYAKFWETLAGGEFASTEFRRLAKDGHEIWIRASYNPVRGSTGKVVKVVKVASDITAEKLAAVEARGQLDAISRSQAMIEFTLAGDVLDANANFCNTMGYRHDEIVGRHHRIFVDPEEAAGEAYRQFWLSLARGQFQAAQYRRLGKGGREVWIQASYNPIVDAQGRVHKIVKYATDITEQKRAVTQLGEGLALFAEGDLRHRIETPFRGELEAIRTAFNHTVDRIAGIVSRLRQSSGSLRTATSEILTGANDLSDRTTRQASAIQQTSAAMHQLSSTVQQNAVRAEAARGKAHAVSAAAEQSGAVMEEARHAMERILASSGKISTIATLIDDIAFQTNLLALNASVEAARAGDAGRGFAVVAVEVRRLAQSAATASADVKSLIEHSLSEVGTGSRLLSNAAERIGVMLGDVRDNAHLVEGIASASKEQSGAIAEVAAAVQQMDKMTQDNSALVEQTNAAIEQTGSQARELDRIVDVFTVDAGQVSPKQTLRRTWSSQGNAALALDWAEA